MLGTIGINTCDVYGVLPRVRRQTHTRTITMKYNEAMDMEEVIQECLNDGKNVMILSTGSGSYELLPAWGGENAVVRICNDDGVFSTFGDKITVTHGGYRHGDGVYVNVVISTDCGKTIGTFRFYEPCTIKKG